MQQVLEATEREVVGNLPCTAQRAEATHDVMIPMNPALRTAAKRVLEVEGVANRGSRTLHTAALVNRLRRVLSRLLGSAGFNALLARALTLAKTEAPALSAMQLGKDGSLVGLSEEDDLAGAEVVLVAHILRLLVAFIGPDLMLRLVNDVWPSARLEDLEFAEDAIKHPEGARR